MMEQGVVKVEEACCLGGWEEKQVEGDSVWGFLSTRADYSPPDGTTRGERMKSCG